MIIPVRCFTCGKVIANKEIIDSFGCTKIDNLDEGLKEADIVSLNVPLNKNTHNMINMEKIKIMKKNSIIINTSRGGIVNEKDLNDALNKGMISGAGLDVYEKEPLSENNKLRFLPNALLTPHIGYVTAENYHIYYSQMIECLEACVNGKPIRIIE